METSTDFPFSSSQVVPQLQSESAIDESNIHKLALSLANPSPVTQKSFDFQPVQKEGMDFFTPQPTGLFSPSSAAAFNIFSTLMTPTPTGQPQASPFTFASSAASQTPYVSGASAPLTPHSSLQPISEQQQPSSNPKSQHQTPQPPQSSSKAAPQTRDVPVVKKEEEQPEDESDQSDQEDPEDEEQGSYEDHVPSSDESDSSYSKKDQQPKRRKRKAAQPLGSNVRCFEDLTDEDIAFMDFKELTRLMNAAGLSRQAIAETKARRRRLKNRQSARLCSNKKRELCNELATDKAKLVDDLKSLQAQHAKLQRDHAALRQQYEALAGGNKRSREY